MRPITRRSFAVTGIALVLASCTPEPQEEVVKVPLPPEDVEVTASAAPINDSQVTGGDAAEPEPMSDEQANAGVESITNGVLVWANQRTDESKEDRAARLAPYVVPDSPAATDMSTPFIVMDAHADIDSEEVSEFQATSGMVVNTAVVSSAAYTLIADFNLQIVTEIAPLMEDGSHPQPVQADPFGYTVQVSAEWNGEAWLISNFARA